MLWARRVPTLLVLDEVHHLARDVEGTHQAWADAIAELAGDVEAGHLNVAGVLNLSGTLWRSDPSERISTVRYSPPDTEGRIVSRVDGEATVQELIAAGELRSVDLYRLDAHVQVEDHATIQFVEGNLSDVDAKVARAAVAHIAEIDSWRATFVASVLDKLEWAHRATDHHVKALIVAEPAGTGRAVPERGEPADAGTRPAAAGGAGDHRRPGEEPTRNARWNGSGRNNVSACSAPSTWPARATTAPTSPCSATPRTS